MTEADPRSPGPHEALLIDFGGVLTVSIIDGLTAACTELGVDADGFLRECFSSSHDDDNPFVAVELGQISTDEFAELVTPVLNRHASCPVDGRQWYSAVEAVTWNLDDEMIGAVEQLIGQGVPAVLVSNSWGPTADYPWAKLPRFTEVVVSRDVGLRKPDPRIYQLAAHRVSIRPERCVFVDDLNINLGPAQELGMATVLHDTAESTAGRLQELFAR